MKAGLFLLLITAILTLTFSSCVVPVPVHTYGYRPHYRSYHPHPHYYMHGHGNHYGNRGRGATYGPRRR